MQEKEDRLEWYYYINPLFWIKALLFIIMEILYQKLYSTKWQKMRGEK